ncbi:MAG: hypothetical protein AAB393_09590, partial [Bacteroidota bacterium]
GCLVVNDTTKLVECELRVGKTIRVESYIGYFCIRMDTLVSNIQTAPQDATRKIAQRTYPVALFGTAHW